MQIGSTIVSPSGRHATVIWRRGSYIGVRTESGSTATFHRSEVTRGF